MNTIENELKNYLENAPEPVQQVLIVSHIAHPIWDDSIEIRQLANQQML